MTVTVTEPEVFRPRLDQLDGCTMVTPDVEGTVVAGQPLPIITAHA